jgi:hypothetical protein
VCVFEGVTANNRDHWRSPSRRSTLDVAVHLRTCWQPSQP